MTSSYPQPLDRLLKLGAEPARRRTWPDYRHLGLLERHAPALVRMATDPALHAAEERDAAGWAPVHAWRALAQLGATEAAAPLLALLEREIDNLWVFEELPAVLGMIGPSALPGATLLLFDEDKPQPVRAAAMRTVASVGLEHPDRRDEAVAILAKQLEDHAHQEPDVNAFLVAELLELEAKEAAPVIEAAFAAGRVDVRIVGDWRDVQVELGLVEAPVELTPMHPLDEDFDPQPPAARSAPAREKERKRRKAEKQSRKRNRKRK